VVERGKKEPCAIYSFICQLKSLQNLANKSTEDDFTTQSFSKNNGKSRMMSLFSL
jgi:hypothetical protein